MYLLNGFIATILVFRIIRNFCYDYVLAFEQKCSVSGNKCQASVVSLEEGTRRQKELDGVVQRNRTSQHLK